MFIVSGLVRSSAVKRSGQIVASTLPSGLPLLLTAPEVVVSGCYKHVTPDGVQKGSKHRE